MFSINHSSKTMLALTAAFAINLATMGKARADLQVTAANPACIVLPADPIASEETAAKELQTYLAQITGAPCRVVREGATTAISGIPIYVGPTQFAAKNLIEKKSFADEEWLMKTQGKAVILTGGRPRGTLYAAYHFLEDIGGVRWWNAWEESVPQRKVLSIPTLNKSGRPAFATRDIFTIYGNDGGRFMARSRLNRQGDAPVDPAYGGSRDYGPPYHVHTLFKYLPPEKYFKDHPDWYIVPNGGTPTPRTGQLCLSNPEMRREFLRVLRENIRTSRQKALEAHLPPPAVYSISQEDNRIGFVCGDNKSLVEKEGSESAIVLDFVNYLADGIKDEFPDVYLDTLAYFSGEKAPRTMHARDNVIVRLTDTQSNVALPITDPRNAAMRRNVEEWAAHCKNLRIWDYAITYDFPQLPTPTIQTYPADLRFLLQHNVEGLFIEFEKPLEADMRDLKLWVLCKLLEDPSQNYDALVKDFTDGFYGPAGTDVRRYLTLLETAARNGKADLDWFARLPRFNFLTLDFLRQANDIYEQAAAKVANDPVLLRRVNNARISVDFAIMQRYRSLMQEWVQSGHSQQSMPLDRTAAAKRFLQTRIEQIDLRLPEAGREAARQDAVASAESYTLGPAYLPPPAKFADVPTDRLFTYSAADTRNYRNQPKVVLDKEAESGFATRLEIPANELEKYKLPMPWGVYNTEGKTHPLQGTIKAADIPGPGYHWYKLGDVTLSGYDYLFFFWSYWIQNDLIDAYDPAHPNAQYEVWADLKFEGPAFPYGKAEDKNAISVERMVLVKK